ncbi:globin domain-containing protein [Acaricomes phytoseiuli]|uniref:globin domain-containing protein n=1 Tax=Acaricomes phytoseiuli TaxID=291968 RepID=UPI0029CA67C5|nr:globin domain-containing protein [Acaricomes phytoseiuli]
MLSTRSRPIIEATLPVLKDRLTDIAGLFYEKLFTAHPELLDGMFNRGNQKSGEQRQALAGSILGYARTLLEEPGSTPAPGNAVAPLLERIAHKHASLGVRPDQYPVVYKYLFAAIAENLGELLNPEIADAWTEVYWLMAEQLIAREHELYEQQQAESGTWALWRVVEKLPAGSKAQQFQMVPADTTPAVPGRAGQYVSVRMTMPDGIRQARQYSLSTDAESTDRRVFTVKYDERGEVSQQLHHRIHPGDLLELSAPYGDISLPTSEGPLVLISAGIGCTPIAAMLHTLVLNDSVRPIQVLHAEREQDSWALQQQMKDDVQSLRHAELHLWTETDEAPSNSDTIVHKGRMDLSVMILDPQSTVYL